MPDDSSLSAPSRPSSPAGGPSSRLIATVVICAVGLMLLLAGLEILRRQRQENASLHEELARTLVLHRAATSRESALQLQQRWALQMEQDFRALQAELITVKADAAAAAEQAQVTIENLRAEVRAAQITIKQMKGEVPVARVVPEPPATGRRTP